MKRAFAIAAGVILAVATVLAAPAPQAGTAAEAAVARRFAAIRRDPLALRAFLAAMPKGGDLHNHLSGSIYAETYLAWAAADGLCLATSTMTIVGGVCDDAQGRPPVSSVLTNLTLFGRAIDAMSMRNWDRSLNGHEHFFGAFGKFGSVSIKTGEMLADLTSRAAAEHVSYLEIMVTPDGGTPVVAPFAVPAEADLAKWRERLLEGGRLRDAVIKAAKQRLDAAEARQRELLHCGTPTADAGCDVTVRFIGQVERARTRELVFAQLVAWFELAGAEPRVVSLNLVQPEDDPRAVGDFALHMSMLDFLHRKYPDIPITLHAGEYGDGMVPPPAMRSHIRQSVTLGHARRIGHGASLISENDPYGLLREMASRKVLVEIALTSNDQILGIRGNRHPLRLYLKSGVPVAIVTDDMGIARSSHTQEFVKAVEEHDLDYRTVKTMVRNSIAYAFADAPTRTRLQANLERALTAFERGVR